MLLTEKEALRKWCPHTRFANGTQATNCAANVEHTGDTCESWAIARCVGSRCAMWRWADSPSVQKTEFARWEDRQATTEPNRDPFIPATWAFVPADQTRMTAAYWVEPEDEAEARRRGYCGLAGKPEER